MPDRARPVLHGVGEGFRTRTRNPYQRRCSGRDLQLEIGTMGYIRAACQSATAGKVGTMHAIASDRGAWVVKAGLIGGHQHVPGLNVGTAPLDVTVSRYLFEPKPADARDRHLVNAPRQRAHWFKVVTNVAPVPEVQHRSSTHQVERKGLISQVAAPWQWEAVPREASRSH